MMLIGILSDTHNEAARTREAAELLQSEGVELLIHCGDLSSPEILRICAVLPCYFVFGNHDADSVPQLEAAAEEVGATCLGWGGVIEWEDKTMAVTHGHLRSDLQPLLAADPNYLFSGHSHRAANWMEGTIRRINPGALFRAATYSVATLDLATDEVKFHQIARKNSHN